MLRKIGQRYFDPEPTSGGSETPPAAPTPETPPAVPAAASDVASHVQDAAQSATQAASETGQDGWKTVADELKGLRGDIKELMGKTAASVPTPEPPAAPTPATPKPPVAPTITPPKPPEDRYIRRNGRKVKRPAR